jgi:predicted  nucleic acid-binding Zn-ribbon protein
MAITNKDIEKMKEVFATKEDLRLSEERAKERHDEVMTTLDQLMKEKETAREDRVFAKAKDDEQDHEISDLKSRIKKVEEKVLV